MFFKYNLHTELNGMTDEAENIRWSTQLTNTECMVPIAPSVRSLHTKEYSKYIQ